MIITKEICTANDFEFWGGAKGTVICLSGDEVERVFQMLEDCYPEGMTETELNDFFWFEDDTIAKWLDWPDFETLMEARSGECWHDTFKEYEEAQEENDED